jgi:hypothetical protein
VGQVVVLVVKIKVHGKLKMEKEILILKKVIIISNKWYE